ncbi:MAG: hypothetical protein KDA33_05960, partial [Phycisphaerales bacterium]|nr:hypothetical protein [Phycisphaerales bacterium]
ASILVTAVMATTLNEHTSLWFVRGMLAFQGLGFALFSSPNMTIIMNSVAPAKVSMASALGAKSRSMGTVTGMLIASILVSVHIGADRVQDHPESMIDIVSSAFVILIIGLSLALLLSIVGVFRDASQAKVRLATMQNRVG